jgi:MoaA/NifB/PqqE/SkfB family radical SAM enzyme
MNDLDNLRKEILNNDSFCFYPFLELSTNPSGHIKPCCYYANVMKSNNDIIGILNNHTFESAWNSDHMISLREDMHKNITPENCIVCTRDGAASMRVRSINEYKNNINVLQLVKNTVDNSYVAKHTPIILELKPSNLCNLKCVMCNSYDSSQVAKELKDLSKKYKGINVEGGRFSSISKKEGIYEEQAEFKEVDQTDWSDDEVVWNSFEKIAPHLEVLSFAGGEPTLIPFVLKVLNYCVDNDFAKNITVFVSSNFTNLNKNFFELMPKYKKFELIASIDGHDKVNDYARFPSKWSQISTNYILAKEYMKYPNVKILNNITVSLLNVVNLVDLLNWIEDRATEYPYFEEWPYNLNLLFSPGEQQITVLPESLKKIAIERLTTYLETSQILKIFPGMDSKIHLIINELNKPSDNKLLEKFKYKISILDSHRGISIKEYIPDLAEIFNE